MISVWDSINVNRSNRPVLLKHEQIAYIKDNVGLYQGRVKIINRQKGRVYLTNFRVIYIDDADTSLSLAIDIGKVYMASAIDGFWLSSPKVKLYVNVSDDQPVKTTSKPLDWVCKICSFNNHSEDFDINHLPRCVSCGVAPTKKYIESLDRQDVQVSTRDDQCSKCTFINHPSLKFCEMCGSELKSTIPEDLMVKLSSTDITETDNKLNIQLEGEELYSGDAKYVKISFRNGGNEEFLAHFNQFLEQKRWEDANKLGNINKGAIKLNEQPAEDKIKESGIFKLQLMREQTRKRNEMTLNSSLEDLENLMYKAQDLIKLSSSFNSLIKPRTLYPHRTNPLTIDRASKFYHEELSRHMSEYLVNNRLGKSSAMMTLQDLFADYNRYLVLTQGFGTQLISPDDLNKATQMFEKLNLPLVLKTYETGLSIIRPKYNDDYSRIIVDFLKKLEKLFKFNKFKQVFYSKVDLSLDNDNYFKSGYKYFKGNSVRDISEHFSWSNDITIEELNKLSDEGLITSDKTVMGTFYFINKFGAFDFAKEEQEDIQLRNDYMAQLIEDQKQLQQEKILFETTMEHEPEKLAIDEGEQSP